MSTIRNRMFSEWGSTRAPARVEDKQSHDAFDRAAAKQTRRAVDRKTASDRDEIAASVVLGYN